MPLINKLNDTKLRSIGYGKDKPYITTDVVTGKVDTGKVPLVDTVLNLIPKQINLLGNKVDIVNSKPVHGVVDASRIGSFMLDLSKGPAFTVKQVALQKMNVIPNGGNQTAIANPFSDSTSFFGKLGSALIKTVNKFTPYPGQLYSPTNTVAQVALQGVGLNIERAGLFPALGVPKYENFFGNGTTGETTNSNVLRLYEKEPKTANKFFNTLSKFQGILSNIPILKRAIPLPSFGNDVLYSYKGGPESLGGLGRTNILRGEIQKGIFTINESVNNSKLNGFNITSEDAFKLLYYKPNKVDNTPSNDENRGGDRLKSRTTPIPIQGSGTTITIVNPRVPFNLLNTRSNFDYAKSSPYSNDWNDNAVSGSLVYKNGYDEEVKITLKNNKISNTAREIRVGAGRVDAVNLTPLFSDNGGFSDTVTLKTPDTTKPFLIRDLVNFRIESIDNNSQQGNNSQKDKQGDNSVWMIFRAYLTNLDDTFNAEWNPFKYSGRGENFYTYTGFSRSVNVGFKVAASSEQEMMPMYQKLNYLASTIMPEYTENGLMRGNYTKLTLGSYFYRQTGIITNLSYKVPNDSPWEIAMDQPETGEKTKYILPHIIEVNMTFIPIGLQHNEKGNLNPKKGVNSPVMVQKGENTWIDNGQIYTQTATGTNDGNFETVGIFKKNK